MRVLRISATVAVAVVALLAGAWWLMKSKAARDRARWKGPALEKLAGMSFTNEVIRRELDELKAGPTPNVNLGWTHDHVILMTNGEYIVYASRHGANSGFVDHLLIGHGSDGRWLYSTYHFCNMLAALRGDDPPGSIAEFQKSYFAREFDGKSDDCLKHTWP